MPDFTRHEQHVVDLVATTKIQEIYGENGEEITRVTYGVPKIENLVPVLLFDLRFVNEVEEPGLADALSEKVEKNVGENLKTTVAEKALSFILLQVLIKVIVRGKMKNHLALTLVVTVGGTSKKDL